MEDERRNRAGESYAQQILDTVRTNSLNARQTFWDPPRPDLEQERLRLLASSAGDDGDAMPLQNPAKPLTAMVFMKLFITLAPMLVIFASIPLLIVTKVDPLGFSMLAFFLTVGLIALVISMADVQIRVAKRRLAKERLEDPSLPPLDETLSPKPWAKDWTDILYLTLSILAIYVVFYGMIWMWATITDDGNDNGAPSPWRIYVDWQAIQTKIGGPSAMGYLGTCLQEALPHRNAMIEDVALCLKSMGMNDSYVG